MQNFTEEGLQYTIYTTLTDSLRFNIFVRHLNFGPLLCYLDPCDFRMHYADTSREFFQSTYQLIPYVLICEVSGVYK